MALELDNYILGESDDTIRVDSSDDCRAATLALTQQAQRSLEIFSHTLDQRVYNNQDLYSAVLRLATCSRYSLIRIIVKDSTDAVKRGSRLVDLSHRLSSRVQIYTPPVEYRDYSEEFVIADDVGLLHRRLATRYQGDLCFYEPQKSRQLKKFFDDCWEKSAPNPSLRRLHL